MYYKIHNYNSGADGVLKKSFFGFQKLNFKNSAFCRFFRFLFLRAKKERFIYTMYTIQNYITLIIKHI